MTYMFDGNEVARLEDYFRRHIAGLLKARRNRGSFAMYALSLLTDGERKSVEPIAARAAREPLLVQRNHNDLLHFPSYTEWDNEAVRLQSARYSIDALATREPITTWLIADTGFLKEGKHSVGVQHPCTAPASKVTNCKIAVGLSVARSTAHLPIDFALYLPEPWANDAARRRKARAPDHVESATKTDLAVGKIEKTARAGLPWDCILADSAFAVSRAFREIVRTLGFDDAVGVHNSTVVRQYDVPGRLGPAISITDLAVRLPRRRFRKVTLREGSKATLPSQFHFCRAKTTHNDDTTLDVRERVWLVIERPAHEALADDCTRVPFPRGVSCERPGSAGARSACTRTSRASSALTTSRAAPSRDGTIGSWRRSSLRASRCRTSPRFPVRPDGCVPLLRSAPRPKRNFADSVITARIAIANTLALWLPRCPFCRQEGEPSCPFRLSHLP